MKRNSTAFSTARTSRSPEPDQILHCRVAATHSGRLPRPVNLSAVSNVQNKDHELIVLDVVDDSVVAHTNAKLTLTPAELQASRRPRILRECPYRDLQPCSNLRMQPTKGLRGPTRDCDPVSHVSSRSQTNFFHQLFERNARLLARLLCCTDISLIFERLDRPVIELRRYDNCTTTNTPGGDHDRLTLRSGDVITLPATELRKGCGSHDMIVLLVQVVLNRQLNSLNN